MKMEIKYTDETARIHMQRATSGSAGLDCVACGIGHYIIQPNEVTLVNLGFQVAIYCLDEHSIDNFGKKDAPFPNEYVGLLVPRSGLATKRGLTLANNVGVIDSDYRGNVKAAMYNRSPDVQSISPGDRICQLLIMPIMTPTIIEVEHFIDENNENERGGGGFGSSGN